MAINIKETPSNLDRKIKESITVRGVCAAIQAMQTPTLDNLKDLLKKAGLKL